MSLPQEAETLKAEGNALYTQGDHNGAIKKYTAAINIASDNAILFANRAASRLALKQFFYFSAFFSAPFFWCCRCRYKRAREDAQKVKKSLHNSITHPHFTFQATELDPEYAKGWGRLGAAFEVSKNEPISATSYSFSL